MPAMFYLSQRDPKWAGVRIGATRLTVANWGCVATSISMLSSYGGFYLTPAQIARAPGQFNALGEIIWMQLAKTFKGRMTFQRRIGSKKFWKRDDAAIKKSILGGPKLVCLLQVNNGKHWVVATGIAGNDYWCADPIDGKKKLVLKAYPNITGSCHLILT